MSMMLNIRCRGVLATIAAASFVIVACPTLAQQPPMADGLLITAELSKNTFAVGEAMVLTCQLHNLRSAGITIEKPLLWMYPPALFTNVENSAGEWLQSYARHVCYSNDDLWREGKPIEEWVITIPPEQSYSFTIDLVAEYPRMQVDNPEFWDPHTVADPGQYTVQCLYKIRGVYPLATINWNAGPLASGPLSFTVVSSP